MAIFIEIKAADGLVSRTRLDPGSNRFTVRLGDSYRVIDDQTGLAPQGVAVKRVDNNLVVDRIGPSDASVELVEFYSVCSAGSPCEFKVESGPGGTPLAITPATQPIGALADGSFVLYDPTYTETAPPAPSIGDNTMVRNVLYGLGGLAVVGIAAGGGGGGGDDSSAPPTSSALKLTSPQLVNSRTPTLTGEGEPGARVIVRVDANGDGVVDVSYNVPVGSDSKWSVNLGSTAPESGALPAGGLPDSSTISITSATAAGNVSLPVFALAVDTTPPARPVINAITGDDQISLSEKADGFVVSGTAEGNASLVVTVGSQSKSTTVDAQGGWQVSFAATAVGDDGPIRIGAVVTDPAGNPGEAAARTATVNTLPRINPVAGDGEISLGEWAAGVAVTGTSPAGTRGGVGMNVTLGGVSKLVLTDAAGNWSALYSAADLPAGGAAAVTAVPSIGGITGTTATASVNVLTTPSITSIAGDNVVTLAERAAGITVAGSTPAGTGAGVALTVGLGAATRAVQTDAAGNWSAVFAGSDTPLGGSVAASAVATAAGATGQQATGSARVDTAPTLRLPIATDGIINQAERTGATPSVISGSAPAGSPDGSQVTVTLSGLAPVAAVVSGGAWSIPISSLGIPAANQDYTVSAVGSVNGVTGEAATAAVRVDTTPSGIVGVFVAFNNVISQDELRKGFVVVGTSEAGSNVVVTLGGVAKPVTVTPLGTWTAATFARSDFPVLLTDPDGPLLLAVTVTTPEGNVSQFNNPIPVSLLDLTAAADPVATPLAAEIAIPVAASVAEPVLTPLAQTVLATIAEPQAQTAPAATVAPAPAPAVPAATPEHAATPTATHGLTPAPSPATSALHIEDLVDTSGGPTASSAAPPALLPAISELASLMQALEQQANSPP